MGLWAVLLHLITAFASVIEVRFHGEFSASDMAKSPTLLLQALSATNVYSRSPWNGQSAYDAVSGETVFSIRYDDRASEWVLGAASKAQDGSPAADFAPLLRARADYARRHSPAQVDAGWRVHGVEDGLLASIACQYATGEARAAADRLQREADEADAAEREEAKGRMEEEEEAERQRDEEETRQREQAARAAAGRGRRPPPPPQARKKNDQTFTVIIALGTFCFLVILLICACASTALEPAGTG